MNYAELKGKIIARGYTVDSFCRALRISRATFDRKMSGKSEFTRDEIARIIELLDLTWDEVRSIFFTLKVA